jgi:hypothetical protein
MELALIVDERRESRDGQVTVVLVPATATPTKYLGSWTLYEDAAPEFVRGLRGGQMIRLTVEDLHELKGEDLGRELRERLARIDVRARERENAVLAAAAITGAPVVTDDAALDADREAAMEGGH